MHSDTPTFEVMADAAAGDTLLPLVCWSPAAAADKKRVAAVAGVAGGGSSNVTVLSYPHI
jgi:hypothetical protein